MDRYRHARAEEQMPLHESMCTVCYITTCNECPHGHSVSLQASDNCTFQRVVCIHLCRRLTSMCIDVLHVVCEHVRLCRHVLRSLPTCTFENECVSHSRWVGGQPALKWSGSCRAGRSEEGLSNLAAELPQRAEPFASSLA